MRYAKPSHDASADFMSICDQLALVGIKVMSGAWVTGMLSIETDQPVSVELLQALGLTAWQGG